MLQLIKYEFIKRSTLFTLLIVGAILGNVGCVLIFGTDGGAPIFTVFVMPMVLIIVYLSDLIKNYSGELNNKTGYMLFMTPNSGYKILFSKLISIFCTGALLIIFYLVIFFINVSLTEGFLQTIESLGLLIDSFVGINMGEVGLLWLSCSLYCVTFILTVYTAITIRKSILSNSKFGGILSFFIFVIIGITIIRLAYFSDMAFSHQNIDIVQTLIGSLVFNGIVSSILATVSGYLLENVMNL